MVAALTEEGGVVADVVQRGLGSAVKKGLFTSLSGIPKAQQQVGARVLYSPMSEVEEELLRLGRGGLLGNKFKLPEYGFMRPGDLGLLSPFGTVPANVPPER